MEPVTSARGSLGKDFWEDYKEATIGLTYSTTSDISRVKHTLGALVVCIIQVPRSPGSSGSRDTTPVVPPGDCPHHTCVARLVLRHYFVGSSPCVCERTPHSPSRLVPQNATNLFRRHCADTRATLGPLEFLHIPSPPACNQNPALAVFQLVPSGLLCSLMDKVELRGRLKSLMPTPGD